MLGVAMPFAEEARKMCFEVDSSAHSTLIRREGLVLNFDMILRTLKSGSSEAVKDVGYVLFQYVTMNSGNEEIGIFSYYF